MSQALTTSIQPTKVAFILNSSYFIAAYRYKTWLCTMSEIRRHPLKKMATAGSGLGEDRDRGREDDNDDIW